MKKEKKGKKSKILSVGEQAGSTPPRHIVFVQSRHDEDTSVTKPMLTYDPDDLIGRTFLLLESEGEHLRATIKQKIMETSQKSDNMHESY